MSFSTAPPRNDAIGDNSTPIYDFTFRIFEKTDLRVVKTDLAGVRTLLVLNTDYTVPDSAVGNPSGGAITLTAGNLPTGYALTIRFLRIPQQQSSFRNQKSFFPEVVEDKFDEVVRFIQQYADDISRALKLPETETGTDANSILGAAAARASKIVGFDASGNLLLSPGVTSVPVSAFINTLLDDIDAAAARATLGLGDMATKNANNLPALTLTGDVINSATGFLEVPSGTSAQRPGAPRARMIRYNSELLRFEGYGAGWGPLGGGATGGGSDAVFMENDQTVNNDYTITSNKNAVSAGPITIASGKTVTVPSGSVWTIV